MTKATGILFTSLTCPNCPPAKNIFDELKDERDDIDLHQLGMHEEQAQRLAKKFGVQAVPTVIFYGPGHEAPMGLVGVQTKATLNKYINIANGTEAHPDKEEKKQFSLSNLFKQTKVQS
ncbi:thioredoxin family protein [Candidatus Woesearchaeota archaeon]|nr:thioredoxin family protein [Candidatus Woesearchaeota archaeon]